MSESKLKSTTFSKSSVMQLCQFELFISSCPFTQQAIQWVFPAGLYFSNNSTHQGISNFGRESVLNYQWKFQLNINISEPKYSLYINGQCVTYYNALMCPGSLLSVLYWKPHKTDIKYKSNIVQKQTSDLYYNVILTLRLQALASSLCLSLSWCLL